MNSYKHDSELVTGFVSGDLKAVREIYDRFYRQICYYADSLIHNQPEAEDIAVESFLKLLQRKATIESVLQIKTFLFVTCRNACIDYLRREKRHEISHAEIRYLNQATTITNDIQAISAEVMQVIFEEIQHLPPQCREIFQLLFFKKYTTEQVATALQISPKTVLNQKAKAVRILRIVLLRRDLLSVAIACILNY